VSDIVYRLDLWPLGDFKIEKFEVVKKTKKTVTIKGSYCEKRYNLKSGDYEFFSTLEKAKLATANIISNRLAYHSERSNELRRRLQEVCQHREINSPFLGSKCTRCDFQVPNPEEYSNGGG